MDLAEFDYELPDELIAQRPPERRDGARMLVLDRQAGTWRDRLFVDFPEYVSPGDCLVVNDSRVFPSRLFGFKAGKEARLQIFLVKPLNADATLWLALVRPGRKILTGDWIEFGEGLRARVVGRGESGERTIQFEAGDRIYERLEAIGHVPLPPYIRRTDDDSDRERYQTVYARERGSVAAPTAGLHFTEPVLEEVRKRGAEIARATLHVGLGTFQPVHAGRVEEHRMHSERYRMEPEEWRKAVDARRVIGIGTTAVRTLESIALTGALEGETEIFIYPGFTFRRTGAMLTNFHLPRTTLLLLVSALAGKELVLEAYRHAVKERYRFFSYGDCMLIV